LYTLLFSLVLIALQSKTRSSTSYNPKMTLLLLNAIRSRVIVLKNNNTKYSKGKVL
jgi:hypothetical protein